MDIKELILDKINKLGKVKAVDIISETGFSRAYVNRFFKELTEGGKLVLIGKANRAHYVKADKNLVNNAKRGILSFRDKVVNKNLSEDIIFEQIKKNTGILMDLDDNVGHIFNYTFTEILNNAIEHSRSQDIEIRVKRDEKIIRFDIIDCGIGIFNNIRVERKLESNLEAIQELLKGKQTTAPTGHSGEGIFFTSKLADNLTIISSNKKLIFNNQLQDFFIEDVKEFIGTKVIFILAVDSNKKLEDVFKEYSVNQFEFDKTKVAVRLYKLGTDYISRSQAKRLMIGLEKFKFISLDFQNIKSVGQGFADEIFRVWQKKNPSVIIEMINTDENIDLMISRAKNIL